jgi:hypothetical protein
VGISLMKLLINDVLLKLDYISVIFTAMTGLTFIEDVKLGEWAVC